MKKMFVMLFQLLSLISFLYAADPYEHTIKQTYPDAAEIQIIGSYKEYTVYIAVYESDWRESLVIYNAHTKTIKECTALHEQSIHSARIITVYATPFIEAVGMTHMGNGSIHLLDFDGNEFFSYPFLDYHHENMYFNAVRDIEVFKHYKTQANEEYSRVIEGGTLHIDYSHFDQGVLRIFGIVTYRAENEQCNTEKTIGSIAVERLFKKRSNTKSAVAAPEADNTMNYILIQKTGVIDGVFGNPF